MAKLVVQGLVYPPILRVRDDILPHSPLGRSIVRDFRAHYKEAVRLLREDRELFAEVLEFLLAAVPFARALTGESPPLIVTPSGETLSTYTARQLRPGMVDWLSRLLERLRSAGSEALGSVIARYQRLLPQLTNLSSRDFLVAMHSPALLELVDSPAVA
jgi:hypothetical protein